MGAWVTASVATAVVQILGADLPISLVALLDQAVDVNRFERTEMASQGRAGRVGRHPVVVVSAAGRLGHDLVRQSEPFQVSGRPFERVGGLPLAGDIAPEDRGAGLGP